MNDDLNLANSKDVNLSESQPAEYSHTHIMVALTALTTEMRLALQTATDKYRDLAMLAERVSILEQRGYIPPEAVITKIAESEARFNDKLAALATATKDELDKIKSKLLPILGGLALASLLAGIGVSIALVIVDKVIPDADRTTIQTKPHNTSSN